MANDLGSGLFGMDFSSMSFGADDAVLPDVSYGGPSEQPSTAAGNGFGEFLTGSLSKALDYAIAKDAASWAAPTQPQGPVPVQPTQQQAVLGGGGISNTMLLIAGLGIVALLVMTGSKS